jgi:hypothetical protein
MSKILQSILQEEVKIESIKCKFLKEKEFDVLAWLKERNFSCALEADLNRSVISIYSLNRNEINYCKKAFEIDFIIQDINIDKTDEQVFVNWIQSASKDTGVFVYELRDKCLTICGFKETVRNVYVDFLNAVL